ncbi:MAG: hypothetical protein DRH12_17920 [Deltaproteobacteria bacterium]|nr:MAG: hypothetical protein DRH12_17920 [Deltaproteobacteria bacterium]
MKVDFLVGPIASSDEDIVFDTRDYYGTTVPKEEILFDIEDAVKWLAESSSKRGAFALLEPLKGISVRDLFLKIE